MTHSGEAEWQWRVWLRGLPEIREGLEGDRVVVTRPRRRG